MIRPGKALSLFLAFLLLFPNVTLAFGQQQGGGGGGGVPDGPINPTDPSDTLLPDDHTDLPNLLPPDNYVRDEERTNLWTNETRGFVGAIDYSSEPKDPLTWQPTPNLTGNPGITSAGSLPWEGVSAGSTSRKDGWGGSVSEGSALIGAGALNASGSRQSVLGRTNTQTGQRETSVPLVSFTGKGDSRIDLGLVYRKNPSVPASLGPIAFDWTHNYDIRLDVSGDDSVPANLSTRGFATVMFPNGLALPFVRAAGTSVWLAPFGVRAKLYRDPVASPTKNYILDWQNGDRWTFATVSQLNTSLAGRLMNLRHRDGSRLLFSQLSSSVQIALEGTGRSVTISYQGRPYFSRIQSVEDHVGRVWTPLFSTANGWSKQISSVQFPNSKSIGIGYVGSGSNRAKVGSITDARGKVWSFAYENSTAGRLWAEYFPGGGGNTYAYLSAHTEITDGAGKKWKHYFKNGALVAVTDPDNFSSYIERNAELEPIKITDARNNVYTLTRDSRGNVTKVRDPFARDWVYTYNGTDDLLTATSPLGKVREWTYDNNGNLLTAKDEMNRTTTFGYNTNNELVTVTDPLSRVSTITYNSAGDVTTITGPTQVTTTFTVDTAGRVTRVEETGGTHTREIEERGYDALDRTIWVENGLGQRTTLAYDLEDNLLTATDPAGRVSTLTYDDAGRLKTSSNGAGQLETYNYNNRGDLLEVINARGFKRTFTYTGAGLRRLLVMPDGTREEWNYTGTGQVSTYAAGTLNATVTRIEYLYDAAERLAQIKYPVGANTSFTYDWDGRTTQMSDSTGTTTWTYNNAGQVTQQTSPQGTVSYTYNGAGERITMAQPQGTTTYNIAANGRLNSIVNMHGETTSLDYNHFDEVTKKTLHGGQYENYSYDSIGRLQTLNVRGPNHSSWRSENYTYNAAGEISQHTVDGVATTYTYDSAGRLQQELAPGYTATYTFDGNGYRLTKTVNGVTESYTYDSGDKLLTAGNKTYTYDEAGRTKTVVGSNGTTFLTYDFESRLTQVSGAPGTHNYTYNGLDTRVSKNLAGQTTSFLRDGAYVTDPVIADSLATYTPGVSERRGGTTRYTHSGLKNTGAQSTNAIVATRVYDAYGAVRNTAGTTGTWSGPFGYAGDYGYQEDETGLRLLGHRYYDASTGRFLTRDPIKAGRNWYSYCDGDPINGVDPTGLYAETLFDLAALGLGFAEFARDPSVANAAWLLVDVAAVVTPAPNLGALRHIGKAAAKAAPSATKATAKVANAATKKTAKASTLAKNKARGKQGELDALEMLKSQGKNVKLNKSHIGTDLGARVPDIVELDDFGQVIRYYEVKTGKAVYSKAQRLKDDWIRDQLGFETILLRLP